MFPFCVIVVNELQFTASINAFNFIRSRSKEQQLTNLSALGIALICVYHPTTFDDNSDDRELLAFANEVHLKVLI